MPMLGSDEKNDTCWICKSWDYVHTCEKCGFLECLTCCITYACPLLDPEVTNAGQDENPDPGPPR